MSLKGSNYPTVRPSLDLPFAQTKRLDPRISYSRSGVATYYDETGILRTAQANQARFDHDPSTGESLGLLVEEARTNSQPYSSKYDTSHWGFSYGIKQTPNATVAPDGTLTATLIQQDTSDSIHQLAGGFGFNWGYITLTSTYTLSLYVKYYNSNKIRFMEQNTYGGSADGSYTKAGIIFNFETESIEKTIQWQDATQSRIAGYSVNKLPNGWYRLNLSVIPGTDSNNRRVYFGIYPQEGNLSSPSPIPSGAVGIVGQNYASLTSVAKFVGDGSTGVYIWGAQVESGSFPTSYIPTPATFTSRSTTATYYDASGIIQTAGIDVARDDAHFPDENGVMRPAGLLLEEARTNVYYPSIPVTSLNSNTANITPNATIAPDGTNTASFVEPIDGGSGGPGLSATITKNGVPVIYSFFYKPNGYNVCGIFYGSGIPDNYFKSFVDVTNPTDTYISGALYGDPPIVTPFPNGWYLVTIRQTPGVGTTPTWGFSFTCRPDVPPPGNYPTYTHTPGSGGYFWGLQIEEGDFPTSYIPTSGSTVTRAADVSTYSTVTRSADVAQITGSNFSSWFNYEQSTMYTEGVFIGDPYNGTHGYLSTFDVGTNDGSFYSRIRIKDYSDSITFESTLPSSGSTTGNITIAIGANAKNTLIRQVHSITNAVSVSAAVNGTLGTNTISSSIQIPNKVQLGKHGAAYLTTCYLRRFIYYPTRLPDATLQKLTQ